MSLVDYPVPAVAHYEGPVVSTSISLSCYFALGVHRRGTRGLLRSLLGILVFSPPSHRGVDRVDEGEWEVENGVVWRWSSDGVAVEVEWRAGGSRGGGWRRIGGGVALGNAGGG